jgi:hypothetical protein
VRRADLSCVGRLAAVRQPLAWLGAAGVLVVPLAGPGGPLSFSEPAHADSSLVISGSLDSLGPGVPGRLALRVRNVTTNSVAIRMLSARVVSASEGCAPSALTVTSWHGRLNVPARGTGTALLPVQLASLSAHCAGATWRLVYTAS